ncbi:MAG: sensor histidine kinase [Candidatus Nanopelagicales bacterium]
MLGVWTNVIAFGLVAVLSIRLMISRPGLLTRWAAVAFLSIAIAAVASALQPSSPRGSFTWDVVTKIFVILLVVFPWSLLEFAMATLPRRPRGVREVSSVVFVGLVVSALFIDFRNFNISDSPGRITYTYIYLGYLLIAIALVAVILWYASRDQPRMVRNRLRMLTLGTILLGIALVLSFTRLGGPAPSSDRSLERILTFLCALFFLLTLASPAWLRRLFAVGSDTLVNRCVEEITSGGALDDPAALLPPLAQLCGSDQAAVLALDGTVVARVGPPYEISDNRLNLTPTLRTDYSEGCIEICLNRLWPFLDERADVNVNLVMSIMDVAIARRNADQKRYELAKQRLLEETQIEQAAELEKVNEELNQFVAIASHDLKAPIRNIRDYVDLLREDIGPGISADAAEDLGVIANSAKKMDELLVALLNYTQIERKASDAFAAVNLAEVADAARRMLASSMDSVGAKVDIVGSFPTVRGNGATLLELVINLLENAIKYRSPERDLRVTISGTPRAGGGCEISVQDNGLGIPDEFREKVFTMFTRLHSDDEIVGTGIGLAVCRKIVERHGGKIWIATAQNPGTPESPNPRNLGTTVIFTLG